MFFANPPYTKANTYSTLVEIYNMRRDMAQSMEQTATLQRRVLRELRQLNKALGREERREQLQDITHALATMSQQLRVLEERGEARADSDCSVEVLHTRDCAPP